MSSSLFDVPKHWVDTSREKYFVHPDEKPLTLRKVFDSEEEASAVTHQIGGFVPGLIGVEFRGHPPRTVHVTCVSNMSLDGKTVTVNLVTNVPCPSEKNRDDSHLITQLPSDFESWEAVEPEAIVGLLERPAPQIVQPAPRNSSST